MGALEMGPDNNDLVYDQCWYCGLIRLRKGPLKVSVMSRAMRDYLGLGK